MVITGDLSHLENALGITASTLPLHIPLMSQKGSALAEEDRKGPLYGIVHLVKLIVPPGSFVRQLLHLALLAQIGKICQ
jgi:hypothetical protein